MRSSGLLPCKLTPEPIPSVVNPWCNPLIVTFVGLVLRQGGRQCDDVISSKDLLVQRPSGRSRHTRRATPEESSELASLTIHRAGIRSGSSCASCTMWKVKISPTSIYAPMAVQANWKPLQGHLRSCL